MYFIIYLISFAIIYLFYLTTVILQKSKIEKFKKSNQVMFFVKRFNLDLNKINITKFMNVIALSNAFIISTAFMTTYLVKNFVLQLLVGFLTLIPLLVICYSLIGKYYIKKGCVMNEYK